MSSPTCLKLLAAHLHFNLRVSCCLLVCGTLLPPCSGGRVFLGRGIAQHFCLPAHSVERQGALSARLTLGKSPRELLACCRVEDGKAKLPVRIAQLLEQGHFLSTGHYCLGALAKKVRQGAVSREVLLLYYYFFFSFLLTAAWCGRLLRAGLMSTGAKSGMRHSASLPHLNSPIFFPLWEAVGHLGRVTWRNR